MRAARPQPSGRRVRRSGLLLGALLMAGALLTPAAEGARPFVTGISYLYIDDAGPTAFENVKRAGGQIVLTPLEWERIVPEERPVNWQPENPADPNYRWKPYDAWVTGAVAAGLTPVLQVRTAPRWAQRCPFVARDTPCDPNPADLVAFTTAAVRRYSGQFGGLPRVQYWQGLNEPNLSMFFEPQFLNGKAVSAELYRVLINSFYAAVKAVDPTNLVIAAGLGPIAVPGFTVGPMQFTRELLCMRGRDRFRPAPGDCEGGVHFDIFDMHPFSTRGPNHPGRPNDVPVGGLPKLAALLKAADRAGRIKGVFRHTPLWVTELSWDSSPPDPGGLPPHILNRWTSEALHNAWKAGVSHFFWFSLRDFEPRPKLRSHESLESGLYYRGPTVEQDQPKEVLYAFRFPFVAHPSVPEKGKKSGKGKGKPQRPELHFWGRTPTGTPGKVQIQVQKGKRWRTVHVVRASKGGVFHGTVPTGYGKNRRGAVRARYWGETSVPFSMKPVKDFRHAPFGEPVG